MAAFALLPRPMALIATPRNRSSCSPILRALPTRPPSRMRTAALNVTMARRQRVDPRDQAFVTCTSCGSDNITSASEIIRRGTAVVTCNQCNMKWTAHAEDALTNTGSPLVNHEAGSADEQDEDALKSLVVKLYVGGLGPKVDSAALRAVLEEFGEVRDARVIYDRVTGRSRGFGFVTIVGRSAAFAAVDVLSGDSSTPLGRGLKIREARD